MKFPKNAIVAFLACALLIVISLLVLFVLIALSVLNSLLIRGQVYGEFAAVNAAIIVILYILERGWGFHYETRKSIVYERIEMIRPENWAALMDDLRQRTGLKRRQRGQGGGGQRVVHEGLAVVGHTGSSGWGVRAVASMMPGIPRALHETVTEDAAG